jgi:hypothetical protein
VRPQLLPEALRDIPDQGEERPPHLGLRVVLDRGDCPGRKPPFLDVKRPGRLYKRAIQTRYCGKR